MAKLITKSRVVVSYSSVHQAFQLALAAHEHGELQAFLCSIFAAPGRWGHQLQRLCGREAVRSRTCPEIKSAQIIEYPWPFLARQVANRFKIGKPGVRLLKTQAWFDRWASGQISRMDCELVVGSDTCCQHTFRAAKRNGKRTLLDRPGIPEAFLQEASEQAAQALGVDMAKSGAPEPKELSARKGEEQALADALVLCSEFQLDVTKRFEPHLTNKCHVIPLWVDTGFWTPAVVERRSSGHLRILYAGTISLRKGVPFLCQAVARMPSVCKLTLVGSLDQAVLPFVGPKAEILPPCHKARLRDIYRDHDLLVLPSLGDAFGFVALEAMACGTPVVVSDHCGVPLPDSSWRVKAMDVGAIQERIAYYADDRTRLSEDCVKAARFAREFSAQAYRERAFSIMQNLLDLS